MSTKFYWGGLWNFESSKWVPLGWRRTFEDTAELVPHVVIEPSTVLHFGVVVCRSKSRQEAELAFAKLRPPPWIGGVDPVRHRH